jgi:phospholipid-translocating ATPase
MNRLLKLQDEYDPALSGGLATAWALILDGDTLTECLKEENKEIFVRVAKWAQSVIVARCAPTQKAEVVREVRRTSPESVRTAAIGDGGNDVSMILAAHVGIGIEGVEGKQASMAADFSIMQFSYCLRLIMWHGRNSYKRSSQLSQFIMHRGIVYAIVQTIFSMMFGGSTMSVFNGYLLMGYATIFTMAPVFALVLNEDYDERAIKEFPELYKQLLKARSMNMRSFLQWVWVSFFQGGTMMVMTVILLPGDLFQLVSVAFTTLLLTELVIVAGVVHFRILWRQRRINFALFFAAEAFSLLCFFFAVLYLPYTFDKQFFFSLGFLWKVVAISAASIGPIFLVYGLGSR